MSQVTMISTSNDGSCGVGIYTGELIDNFPSGITVEWLTVPLGSGNPLPYVQTAILAGLTDNPTVHVQHEYGIYGPKSLWSWLFFPVLFLLTRLRDQRVIITLHSAWNGETIGPPLTPLKEIYVALNNRLLAITANHVVFLSDNASADFQRSVKLESVETIPHGVQLETRSFADEEAAVLLGYDSEDTLIVEPGYIRPEKGCDAFIEIARHFEDARFLLAGGCQNAKTYCETLESTAPPNLEITGQLDEEAFHAVFVAADLVVLPYREVTQSGVFNWCVAYGVPVIGSDTAYFRSLANEWGCVEVVNTENADATAERVQRLLADEDQRSALIESMADYRKAASMESVGEQHAELYATK